MDKRPWTTHDQVDAEFTEPPALAEEQLDERASLSPEGSGKIRAIDQLRLAWSELQRGWLAVHARMSEEGVRYARTRGGQDRGTP